MAHLRDFCILEIVHKSCPTCCVLLKPLAIRCWQWRNSGCAYEWIYLKDSKSEYINTYIHMHYYAFDGSSAFFWQGTVLVQSFSRVSTLVIAHYLGSLASLFFLRHPPGCKWNPDCHLVIWMPGWCDTSGAVDILQSFTLWLLNIAMV